MTSLENVFYVFFVSFILNCVSSTLHILHCAFLFFQQDCLFIMEFCLYDLGKCVDVF